MAEKKPKKKGILDHIKSALISGATMANPAIGLGADALLGGPLSQSVRPAAAAPPAAGPPPSTVQDALNRLHAGAPPRPTVPTKGIGGMLSGVVATARNSMAAAEGQTKDDEWLATALSGIGGGPDRNAYVAPFDQAAQRAQASYDQTLPQIAALYAGLRDQLSASQGQYATQAGQVQANQASQAAANQQLLQSLQAPVLADLQAQGGQAAVGGLTGALQAQMAAGQAQVGQGAAAQQQLSQNMAQAQANSGQARIEDTRLAEASAGSYAKASLGDLLGQVALQRAGAERQYAGDQADVARQRAQVQLSALERSEARSDKAADPMRRIQLEGALLDLEDRGRQREQADLSRNASQELRNWHSNLASSNPVSYDYLTSIAAENDALPAMLARINRDAKDGKVKHDGKKLDVATLIRWAREADDISERAGGGSDKKSK